MISCTRLLKCQYKRDFTVQQVVEDAVAQYAEVQVVRGNASSTAGKGGRQHRARPRTTLPSSPAAAAIYASIDHTVAPAAPARPPRAVHRLSMTAVE